MPLPHLSSCAHTLTTTGCCSSNVAAAPAAVLPLPYCLVGRVRHVAVRLARPAATTSASWWVLIRGVRVKVVTSLREDKAKEKGETFNVHHPLKVVKKQGSCLLHDVTRCAGG